MDDSIIIEHGGKRYALNCMISENFDTNYDVCVHVSDDGNLVVTDDFEEIKLPLTEIKEEVNPSDKRVHELAVLMQKEIYNCMEHHHTEAVELNTELLNLLGEVLKNREKIRKLEKEIDQLNKSVKKEEQ